jgi:glycosyltransferase involved in cell wall biosynthesis
LNTTTVALSVSDLRKGRIMPSMPRVSICIPVRNGQKYLAECIESVLTQTFSDFELIICDNASTDATESICRRFAARDSRIHYVRHDHNLGPAENFNSGLDLSRGEYFRWQAHDDLIAPEYLHYCVEALDSDPSVVEVYPRVKVINDLGDEMEDYDFAIETDSPSLVHRFRQIVLAKHRRHRNFEIFGLMRRSAVQRVPRQGAYSHADRVFTSRITLQGRVLQIPQRLFLARWHPTQSMQARPDRARASVVHRILGPGVLPPPEWWNPELKNRVTFPEWNLLREHARSIRLAGSSMKDRAAATLVVAEWILHNWPKLLRDLIFAMDTVTARLMDRGDRAPEPAMQRSRRVVG